MVVGRRVGAANAVTTIRFSIPHCASAIPHFHKRPVFIRRLAAKHAKFGSEEVMSVTDRVKSVTDLVSLVTDRVISATKILLPSLT